MRRFLVAVAAVAGIAGATLVAACGDDHALPAPTGPSSVDLAVTKVTPVSGLSGITVRISGTGFGTGTIVTMGGIAARTLSSTFSTIDVIAPDRKVGSADVIVTNPSGRSVTVTGGFRFTTVRFVLSASVVTAGGELTASWFVPDQNESGFVRGAEDAISLWSVDTGNLMWWFETTGTTSGTRTFNAPSEPGRYELQYRDFNELRTAYARVMGRIVITVTAAGTSAR